MRTRRAKVGSESTTALDLSPSSILGTLHKDTSFILSTLLVVSAGGIAMEQKTTFGKALSASISSPSIFLFLRVSLSAMLIILRYFVILTLNYFV